LVHVGLLVVIRVLVAHLGQLLEVQTVEGMLRHLA
jgi:hypothetical protein